MEKIKFGKIFTLAVLIVALCIGVIIPAWATVEQADTNAKVQTVTEVLYEEDFDDVTERVDLISGENTGAAEGWTFAKNASGAKAYIEDGKLHLYGNKYDIIYRTGESWTDYTLEADIYYKSATASSGWIGMIYNVQSEKTFQKAGIAPNNKKYSLNGRVEGKWKNDVTGINKGFTLGEDVNFGEEIPVRLKVVTCENEATLYYAFLNNDGTMKTDYVELLKIDNIPEETRSGSIGFMTSTDSTASAWIDNIKVTKVKTIDSDVLYENNFDDISERVDFVSGENTGAAEGWTFAKNSDVAKAYIEDGKLHLYGNKYDVIYRTGESWTNYTLEADMYYEDGNGKSAWAGMIYNVQSEKTFQKAGINPGTKKYSLNGMVDGSWKNDVNGINKGFTFSDEVGFGKNVPFRLKVVTYNNNAVFYYALLNEDGTMKTDYQKLITIDNIPEETRSGSIGFMTSTGGSAATTASVWIDNIKVSNISESDMMTFEANAAQIYEPETGIVNPPVVVEKLSASLPAVEGERAAVVIAELDAQLNVLDKNGAVLTTAAQFIDTYRTVLIPAFVVDSEAEADAIAALLHDKNLTDAYVMASAENAALVKRVRLANETTALISGALIFGDLNSPEARSAARELVVDNMSFVAVTTADVNEDTAFYFAARQVALWGFADNTADVYRGIANGYHGIVSENIATVYDVYESITEPTVSGKTLVIAHRGVNSGADIPYPENTLMAIRAAKEIYGADAVEIDFGLTKDGYVILMHDSTIDRTTNGTGNFSDYTLAELKEFKVDCVAGKETEIPTLDEALVLAKELDIVLYCHVKTNTDENIAAFSYLVDKYDCSDRVLLFTSSMDKYNSNVDRVVTGTGYELTDSPVLIDGIQFTAGNQKVLSSYTKLIDGVAAMKKCLNKYNFQPLFYAYDQQGDIWADESFYYQLSARGFVNVHSITNGQANMDSSALTGSGAVGWLTNNPQYCDDYHYGIDTSTEKLTLEVGETINTSKVLKLIMGTANAECGLIQVDGKNLTSIANSYTLNEVGEVTVVYYATRTADGGSTYRVYSEPVKISFVPKSVVNFTPKSSITLSSGLVYNVYVPAVDYLQSFTVDGKTYENLNPVTLADGNRYYHIPVSLTASKAARNIVLKAVIIIDGNNYNGTWTMSISKYAKKVIEFGATEEVTLVKDVLSYVRSAYAYFNTEDAEQLAMIDAILGENYDENNAPALNGSAEAPSTGLSSATYILNATPTIRFHITGEADSYAFYVNGNKLKTVVGTDDNGTYIEMDVYAYAMCETITYTINGVESGSYHINSYYTFVTTDEAYKDNSELISLVARFAKYCESAAAYRNSVIANS